MNRHTRLKTWMFLKGLRQTTVAKEAGVTRQMISNYVTGQCGSKKVRTALLKLGVPKRLVW